jgi:dynein heavy chain
MSGELEAMGNSMVLSLVPAMWAKVSYPSLKPLGSWVNDLLKRLEFLGTWMNNKKAPTLYWISGFFFTQAFITGTLQNYARKCKVPIDTVAFDFRVLKADEMALADTVGAEDGAFTYGLFIDGARWNEEEAYLDESHPRELFVACPHIHLWPRKISDIPLIKGRPECYTGVVNGTNHVYSCPVYKTSIRFGVLMTTGHSTNFVMYISLPMAKTSTQKHWIKRGVAMITSLDE